MSPTNNPLVEALRGRIEYATGQFHNARDWAIEDAPDGNGTLLDWVCNAAPATGEREQIVAWLGWLKRTQEDDRARDIVSQILFHIARGDHRTQSGEMEGGE